jgi:hypothetical protein
MNKIIWYLKQLFPFLYITTFTEEGKRKLCIWRMWFGKSFKIRYWEINA